MKDGGGQCGLRRWRTKGQLPNITAMPQRPPPARRRAGARGRRKEEADRLRQASHGRGRAGFKDDRLQFDMKQMRQKHTSPQPTSPRIQQPAAGGLAVASAHLPR